MITMNTKIKHWNITTCGATRLDVFGPNPQKTSLYFWKSSLKKNNKTHYFSFEKSAME